MTVLKSNKSIIVLISFVPYSLLMYTSTYTLLCSGPANQKIETTTVCRDAVKPFTIGHQIGTRSNGFFFFFNIIRDNSQLNNRHGVLKTFFFFFFFAPRFSFKLDDLIKTKIQIINVFLLFCIELLTPLLVREIDIITPQRPKCTLLSASRLW